MKFFKTLVGVGAVMAMLSLTMYGEEANAQTQVGFGSQQAQATAGAGAGAIASPITTFEGTDIPRTTTSFRTPDVIMNAAPATAPCRIAIGGGLGLPWIGGGANGSVEDPKCTRRENARILDNCKTSMCVALMCGDPDVKAQVPGSCNKASKEVALATEDQPLPKTAALDNQPKFVALDSLRPIQATTTDCQGYKGTDQVVRRRMGCSVQ